MEQTKSILDFLHFAPTAEQKTALLAMADFVREENKDDFLILCGAAGTGKTSITAALIGYLNQSEKVYEIAAPTGRAARILGRKTNVQTSTIHSLIYIPKANPETGEVHFKLKVEDVEDNSRIYIIDEASMINAKTNVQEGLFVSDDSLLNDLIKFIKQTNLGNKLILLGDRNQLPPVNEEESYALIPEYLRSKFELKGEAYFLTEVKRQEDGSNILKNAINLRKAIDDGVPKMNIDADRFPDLRYAVGKYINDFTKNDQDYCISIGCTHKSNRYFNDIVRKALFGADIKALVKGDMMLVTKAWSRNNHRLYMGDHVIIEEVYFDKLERLVGLSFVPVKVKAKAISGEDVYIEDYLMLESIDSPTGNLEIAQEKILRSERYARNKNYSKSGNPEDDTYVGAIRLTYGHSITCNKAQGGEWEKVYVNTYHVPNLKWMYTAVTRAKTALVQY